MGRFASQKSHIRARYFPVCCRIEIVEGVVAGKLGRWPGICSATPPKEVPQKKSLEGKSDAGDAPQGVVCALNSPPNPSLAQPLGSAARKTMVTSIDSASHFNQPPVSRSLGYDFALLGLNAREARVDVIREAARNTAIRIHEAASEDQGELDVMLSDLATSTYRLLDPRRRNKPLERIQLCLFGESDLELQQLSRTPLLRQAAVLAELVEPDDEAQLRLAQREIVQQLVQSQREARARVGTMAVSLLTALALAAATTVFAIN